MKPKIQVAANLFIYQARKCYDGGNRVRFIFIAFLEERESVEKIVRMKDGLVSTFFFLHANIEEKLHLSSPITAKAS